MKNLEAVLDTLFLNKDIQNIAIKIGRGDEVIYQTYRSENQIDEYTLFDMASVSKIMCTTTLALIALDKGLLKLEDTVDKFFDCPKEKQTLTIFNLLTHTIGIGHKSLNIKGNTYDNIAEYILKTDCDIPIGSDVLYSCPGFILLGKILEKVFNNPLDVLFKEYVCEPLKMEHTCFRPTLCDNAVNSNLEPQRKCTVNDYNCFYLGGVAGNAGVFSNIKDVTKFAQFLLNFGAPLISEKTFKAAIQNHTENMSAARGLGYVYVDERYTQTGDLFSVGSIGHCGHTGQSVFVDFESGLYVIILSDATISSVKKLGHDDYEAVMKMRQDLHNAIKKDIDTL